MNMNMNMSMLLLIWLQNVAQEKHLLLFFGSQTYTMDERWYFGVYAFQAIFCVTLFYFIARLTW